MFSSNLFASNIYFYLKTDYFSRNAEEMPLLHTWSLSLEEQFYVLFPLIMIAFARYNRREISIILFGGWTLSLFLSQETLPSTRRMRFSCFLPARGSCWSAILAINYPQVKEWFSRFSPFALLVTELIALFAIGISLFKISGSSDFPGINALPVVFGTATLIAVMTESSVVGRVFSSSGFVQIGLLSYSAYLIHFPIFVYGRLYFGELGFLLSVFFIILTFILAYWSWKFIETPFRLKRRFSRVFIFSTGIAATLLLAFIGLITHIYDGFPGRYSDQYSEIAVSAVGSPYRDECHTDGKDYLEPEAACIYGAGNTTWAVFGDSHAVELAFALSKRLYSGEGVKHLSFSGCPRQLAIRCQL